MAGGVKIAPDRIDAFAESFERYAAERLSPEDLQPVLRVDAVVEASDLALAVIRQVRKLAPFGMGNPRPVLACQGCRLSGQPRRVGRDGSHLQFVVKAGDRPFKAIAFGRADLAEPLTAAAGFDVAFEPDISTFRGETVEMIVRDVRFPG
jgi:single-stranded-DNA-specific exonuclease